MPLLKRRSAEENEHFLEETGLSSMRKKLLCQLVKSFYISSMLMKEGERSRWIVNEGTFLMMNTFDLLIDHLFFECRYHPWTVRNALDFFVESYSYKDQCGISFTHDMGSHYVFTPKGQSSYEIPYLTDCLSYMTQEQLCNWILAQRCMRTEPVTRYGFCPGKRHWWNASSPCRSVTG